MSIKNEEAHRRTEELVKLTGEGLTTAVTESVRQRLERVHSGDDLAQFPTLHWLNPTSSQ